MTALTPEDKLNLLTQAGVSIDDAQEMVFAATPTVIHEENEKDQVSVINATKPISVIVPVSERVTPADDENEQASELDITFKRIIGKAYADKVKALSLCDAEGQAYFDTHKLSKVQAAARDIDKGAHNKSSWVEAQKITHTLKRMVRDHFNVTSVRTKIAASKQALPQAVRDLDDAALERLLASEEFLSLLNKNT